MNSVLDLLMAPLARLMMARGQRFADVAEHLRRSFFRQALLAQREEVTDSKLSVLTGLQRRDIARLRTEKAAPAVPVSPLARLVATWTGDARYAGRVLPRRGAGSFDELAMEIRKDVHPRTLLDQLVVAGTVRVDGDEVTLLQKAFQPLPGSDGQMAYLAQNVGDHLSAAVANVLEDAGHLEVAVHYNQLSDEAVAELEVQWRAAVADAMADLNSRALALQESSSGQSRFRAGAYFWQEEGS